MGKQRIESTMDVNSCDQTQIRRSGNYKPPMWDFNFVQSFSNDYLGERYVRRAAELKLQVKMMLEQPSEPLEQLELIDNLQRLGISYHFEDEIKHILRFMSVKYNEDCNPRIKDLYTAALEFRLLRQHGFNVSQEIFDCFKNESGDFNLSLCKDTKGLLQLYEASFMSTEGETTLEMARKFTTKHLHQHPTVDQDSALLVKHAMEFPLHRTIPRAEARWFTHVYSKNSDINPVLLEFAKLDFNLVQATHLDELKQVSRWWKRTRLAEKLPFARDRVVECFFCTIGGLFEPQYGSCRKILAKVMCLLTTIDDIYDVYGTLEELELFTRAFERWDVNTIEQLPDYMQICFLALINFVNEIAYDVLKGEGLVIIQYLRKVWTDISKAYLQEAKWYFSGYTPKMKEYMYNARITISSHVIMTHAFFSVTSPIDREAIEYLLEYSGVIRRLATIIRLSDDLATSSDELERGDVATSIQCYINETGASEGEACKHIMFLIEETWKKLNKDQHVDSPFSPAFVGIAVNLARMAQYLYQHGDGIGKQNSEIKRRMLALLFEPIPLE